MTHANAPLNYLGKRLLIERLLQGRPIAHVAREMGISRQTASKWWARYLEHGDEGLVEGSSRPDRSPTAIADNVADLILTIRRDKKWGAERIAAYLSSVGVEVSGSTVHRTLQRNGLSRLSDMDRPTGSLL